MTRRLDGLKRVNQELDLWAYGGINKFGEHIFYPTEEGEAKYPNGYPDDFNGLVKCPYEPPQRRWVRETWRPVGPWAVPGPGYYIQYRSDNAMVKVTPPQSHEISIKLNDPWRPSIFMPRWASRITLEVLSAPPERIQEISEEDIEREGVLGDSYLYDLGITKRDPRPLPVLPPLSSWGGGYNRKERAMRKVKVFKGWIGKDASVRDILEWDEYQIFPYLIEGVNRIYKTKGTIADWHINDWPPKKVKITVEIDD